jgi:hypothetical protein
LKGCAFTIWARSGVAATGPALNEAEGDDPMAKATRRTMFLAELLEERISDVGGNEQLAKERIIADMDAHRLEVTWEDSDGATYKNILPAGCPSWWHAHFDWSESTARWIQLPAYDYKFAYCIRVRPARKPPTTVKAETSANNGSFKR